MADNGGSQPLNEQEAQALAQDIKRIWADLAKQFGMHDPDWRPLEAVLGGPQSKLCSAFMFMGYDAGPEGSGGIRMYKHVFTRRYLFLDANARPYRYVLPDDWRPGHPDRGRYEPITYAEAFAGVYEGLERLGVTPATGYDEYERRLAALEQKGVRVIRAEPS